MAAYSSATPSYAPNAFAAGAAAPARTEAYANALRSYAPNEFAGKQTTMPTTAMAPHLSQANPLDPDLVEAYKQFQTDPQAQQYRQSGMDIEKLWRLSPKSPVFQAGYAHNPYIMQRAEQLRQARMPKSEAQKMLDQGYYPSYDEQGNITGWQRPEMAGTSAT
jgi:hypothetical protein